MISVKDLTKSYKSPKKQTGNFSILKDLVSRKYTETKAVDNISFEIDQGELVGFVGPNGAGKTTTMKMLSGILYPTSGSIHVLGHVPFKKEYAYLRQIAFLMGQKNQLLWDLPAEDSFLLNKEVYEISDDHYKKTLDELRELLEVGDLIFQPVKTLSLGERMKMELITSLLHQPKVLFLDEPTIGLDVVAQKTIRDFIKEYQRRHKATILLTSHYMEDVRQLCPRVMIIDHGKIIYDGMLQKLIEKYATEKTIELTLDEVPSKKIIDEIDGKAEIEFPKIKFRVSRAALPEKIEEITKKLSFTDLNVYEERIEDIIRKIFEKS